MNDTVILKEHNQKTYEIIKEAYKTRNHIGIVQATGTGKSYIIGKCIEDMNFKKVLLLVPSLHIINQFKETFPFLLDRVEYMTYKKLTFIKDFDSFLKKGEYDFIVLDEYHRCGARTWIKPVKDLLCFYKHIKVLGVTATPIRYLDGARDMTKELFNSSPLTELSLKNAIKENILPAPKYIISYYNIDDELEKLRLKSSSILNAHGTIINVRYVINNLHKLSNIESILSKHISRERKFIIFCSNVNHLREMTNIVSRWFNNIGFKTETFLVYTENNHEIREQTQRELAKFNVSKGSEDTVQLLFTINILNEGVHISDVDGLIFLRKTVSPTILFQQLGRSFSAGAKHTPIIFDFVNNINKLSFNREKIKAGVVKRNIDEFVKDYTINSDIEVIDYTAQINNLLEQIENINASNSWTYFIENLKQFKEDNGHCNVPSKHPLYKKCLLLRNEYLDGTIDESIFNELDALGFTWNKSIYNDELWECNFSKLVEFKKLYGHCDVQNSYEDKQLATWVHTQRKYKDTMPESRKLRLEEIGFNFELAKIKNRQEWELMFIKLLDFKKQFGHVNVSSRYEDKKLANWVNSQRKAYKAGKLETYRYSKLIKCNFKFPEKYPSR